VPNWLSSVYCDMILVSGQILERVLLRVRTAVVEIVLSVSVSLLLLLFAVSCLSTSRMGAFSGSGHL